jgi:hypothetical protein
MSASVPRTAGLDVAAGPASFVMRKLPHVTVLFWILKIVAVTLGTVNLVSLPGCGGRVGVGLGGPWCCVRRLLWPCR